MSDGPATGAPHSPHAQSAPGAPGAPLSRGLASAAVLVAAVGFSSISIATVIGTREGTSLTSLVMGRFLLAGLFILVTSGWRSVRLPRDHAWRLVVQGGVGQVLINLLNLTALDYIPAATTVFLFYTFPAWVAILAAIRGTERVGPLRTFALLLSLSGILIIIGAPGTGELDPTGATLSLSAAFLYALYIPLLRRLQRGTTPTTAVFWIAVGVCVILLAYGAARDELTLAVTARSLGALLWLAIIPTLLAFRLFLRGLETLGPVRTAIIVTAEPFCAAILAALVLGERMTPSAMSGGVLIAAAVLLLQRPERNGTPAAAGDAAA
jgi:drug/metabolite transporter (DMT)-like permease